MLAEERHNVILQKIKETHSIRIAELCSILEVTRETIRRDLYELEAKGLVKRVHGGAVLDQAAMEPPYRSRRMANVEEKQAIARQAASLVEDGDSIFLDLGTTTLLLARQLRVKRNLTVITNSIPAALEFSDYPDIKTILLGGELRSGELSLSGPLARKAVEEFYVDKSFIGVAGIALHSGFTDYHVGEAEIRRVMLERGKMNIALADFSKFNVTALTKIADIGDMDVVVTDDKSPIEIIQRMEEQGVRVLVQGLTAGSLNNLVE